MLSDRIVFAVWTSIVPAWTASMVRASRSRTSWGVRIVRLPQAQPASSYPPSRRHSARWAASGIVREAVVRHSTAVAYTVRPTWFCLTAPHRHPIAPLFFVISAS